MDESALERVGNAARVSGGGCADTDEFVGAGAVAMVTPHHDS